MKYQFVDFCQANSSPGADGMAFHVNLIGCKDLSGEIYREMRRAIVDWRLRPGARLPPSRELARGLVVACRDKNSRAGVMLGYGAIPTARIEEGLCLLQACFDA